MAKTSRWKLRKPSIEVLQELLRVGVNRPLHQRVTGIHVAE